MPKGQSKRHSSGQIVEKLRSGDAMLNADKTVAGVIQFPGVSEQTHSLVINELSPSEVSVEMNDLLLSAIATPSEKYATPREVFRKLVDRHKEQTENHHFNGP